MDEKEKQEIIEDAKRIMESFGRALAKVEKETQEALVERKMDRRKERMGKECDMEFRNILFQNAPKKEKDCLIAEKGAWA